MSMLQREVGWSSSINWLTRYLLQLSNALQIYIQAVNITVQEAMKAANVLTSHLRSIRNESTFDHFYDQLSL